MWRNSSLAGLRTARPRKSICILQLLSAPSASSVSEQSHPLLMVLKAPDYGFIGLKLKDLISGKGQEESRRRITRLLTGVYRRFNARHASATDFLMRADSSRTPPTLMRKKVLPFKT